MKNVAVDDKGIVTFALNGKSYRLGQTEVKPEVVAKKPVEVVAPVTKVEPVPVDENSWMEITLDWENENKYSNFGFTSSSVPVSKEEAKAQFLPFIMGKGFDDTLPTPLKIVVGDFAFNHKQDPRLGLLQTLE